MSSRSHYRARPAVQSSAAGPDSCESSGHQAVTGDLPRHSEAGKLDPDVVAFVEALARYSARKDHEAQEATGER